MAAYTNLSAYAATIRGKQTTCNRNEKTSRRFLPLLVPAYPPGKKFADGLLELLGEIMPTQTSGGKDHSTLPQMPDDAFIIESLRREFPEDVVVSHQNEPRRLGRPEFISARRVFQPAFLSKHILLEVNVCGAVFSQRAPGTFSTGITAAWYAYDGKELICLDGNVVARNLGKVLQAENVSLGESDALELATFFANTILPCVGSHIILKNSADDKKYIDRCHSELPFATITAPYTTETQAQSWLEPSSAVRFCTVREEALIGIPAGLYLCEYAVTVTQNYVVFCRETIVGQAYLDPPSYEKQPTLPRMPESAFITESLRRDFAQDVIVLSAERRLLHPAFLTRHILLDVGVGNMNLPGKPVFGNGAQYFAYAYDGKELIQLNGNEAIPNVAKVFRSEGVALEEADAKELAWFLAKTILPGAAYFGVVTEESLAWINNEKIRSSVTIPSVTGTAQQGWTVKFCTSGSEGHGCMQPSTPTYIEWVSSISPNFDITYREKRLDTC